MAVRLMARFQLGRTLTSAQAESIASFLGALTGEVDGTYTAKPELPASGPDTPASDASVDPT
jgi:cytochrome c peroxidase